MTTFVPDKLLLIIQYSGPRICLGQQFALTEASYVTVRLLQRFEEMTSMETDPVVRQNLTLTSCSGNGVKVCLREAAK